MRFYNHQHQYYCGIDLHAKTMYLCILDATGQVLVHRNSLTGHAWASEHDRTEKICVLDLERADRCWAASIYCHFPTVRCRNAKTGLTFSGE